MLHLQGGGTNATMFLLLNPSSGAVYVFKFFVFTYYVNFDTLFRQGRIYIHHCNPFPSNGVYPESAVHGIIYTMAYIVAYPRLAIPNTHL